MRADPPGGPLSAGERREAASILRSCVHCGFCNATCPTYQQLGDELDGPRGRIVLIKALLEGEPAGDLTRRHLDRCLSCRACETTCPSGVRYGRLLDIARGAIEERAGRPWRERLARGLLRRVLTRPGRFRRALHAAGVIRRWLPGSLGSQLSPLPPLPPARALVWPAPRHARRMLILEGCVQPVLAPAIDYAAARVLDRLGISLVRVRQSGCCGALSYHLGAHEEGRAFMRRNIDACWDWVEQGAEAIVSTASGCGVMLKDYGVVLGDDLGYADKAARLAGLVRDIGEVLAREDLSPLQPVAPVPLAFQSPCTLQHGQRLGGVVEALLARLGFRLLPVADAHLCCGSAGTYSVLQPELATRLRDAKLAALQASGAGQIVTANIGCLTHLCSAATLPVRHWLELLADAQSRDA